MLVPNLLTALRLTAMPVVVWLILGDDGANGSGRWWALSVFLVASATDFLDGHLARRWQVVTSFGKLADPIADKVLVLAVLASLCIVDDIPWWPLAILILREVAVTLGRLGVAKLLVIPASRGGKLKTALQIAAITFYLWPPSPAWLDTVAWWCLIVAVAVAVLSGIDYMGRIVAARRLGGKSADAGGQG
ncbi:MAG: CDP-diacylglycerol--glycerol-3-phosphate 3-phosphatidyltransferase [Demequinaceae bacterium]|nr:CDP-diacylglycerol--glycerol-3-phosphate 3-phosphatidyltransferase [Demequinaceae bacterium]